MIEQQNVDATSRVVVFLDFDGVTHSEPCGDAACFSQLPLIESVLRGFASVEIVISSSWRDKFNLDDLRDFFAPDMAARVMDVTPSIKRPSSDWLPGNTPKHEREWEIESWMKANRDWNVPWIAIDDRPYWFRPDSPNLLLTDSKTGFTQQDQERLQAMIKARL